MTDHYRQALEGLRERCAQEAERITARRRAVTAISNNEAVKPCKIAAAIRKIDVQQYYEGAAREIERLRARVAELERDLDACRVELLEAQHTVGEGWFAGGATLAEGIARKCRMLEGDNETACENTPWPGCECPGCGTARERAEAELNGGDR